MNIYLLAHTEGFGATVSAWDTCSGNVVVAPDEATARTESFCGDECGCGGKATKCVWSDPTKTTCRRIGTAAPEMRQGVVMTAFQNT